MTRAVSGPLLRRAAKAEADEAEAERKPRLGTRLGRGVTSVSLSENEAAWSGRACVEGKIQIPSEKISRPRNRTNATRKECNTNYNAR